MEDDREVLFVTHPSSDADRVFLDLRHSLVRQAARTVGSVSEAEDVVQETWLRWREHHAAVESAPRWLRTVTRNLAIDHVRRRAAHPEVELDREHEHHVSIEAGFDRADGLAEVAVGLRVILGSLSGLERVVFVLRESLDWPHADIARLIGRSEEAVRQLQHRASRHVRAASPRFDVSEPALLRASRAFVSLGTGGDVASFLDALAPDVVRVGPGLRRVDDEVVHEVAGIVLRSEDGRLLLCHRRPSLSWYPDVWDVAGSHLMSGEPPAACAVRAARLKLRVSVVEPVPLVDVRGDGFRLSLFRAGRWDGTPRNAWSEQHDAVRFFTREEAAGLELADPRYLELFDRVA